MPRRARARREGDFRGADGRTASTSNNGFTLTSPVKVSAGPCTAGRESLVEISMYLGDSDFGFAQSVVPSTSGDKISLKLLTPFFDIPLYSFTRPVKDRIAVDFYDPFVGP